MNKSLIWVIKKRKSWPLNQSQDLSPFTDAEPIGWISLRKDPITLPETYTVSFSPSLPPKGQGLLQGWRCTGENEIIKDFSRITRHWLWTDINSRRPKTSLWPTCQNRGLWRSDDRWRFSSGPSNSGCLYPSCGYFPSFRMYNWNRHTQQLAESPHYFLNVPNLADSTAPLWLIKLSSTTLLLRKQFLKDKWTLTYLKTAALLQSNPIQFL